MNISTLLPTATASVSSAADPLRLDVTDTAKIVRKVLKAAFPEVKFSVKSNRGSFPTADVSWVDGPRVTVVDEVLIRFRRYSGSRVDDSLIAAGADCIDGIYVDWGVAWCPTSRDHSIEAIAAARTILSSGTSQSHWSDMGGEEQDCLIHRLLRLVDGIPLVAPQEIITEVATVAADGVTVINGYTEVRALTVSPECEPEAILVEAVKVPVKPVRPLAVVPDPVDEFFGPVVYKYTRAEALEDGVQVKLPEEVETRFKYPIYLTSEAWGLVQEGIKNGETACVQGIMWDITWMLTESSSRKYIDRRTVEAQVIIQGITSVARSGGTKTIPEFTFRAEVGPVDDDDPKPCVTIDLVA